MTNQPRGGLGLCPRMVMALPVHSARGPQLGNNEAADKVFKGIQVRTQSREDHSVAERHFAEVDRTRLLIVAMTRSRSCARNLPGDGLVVEGGL